PRKPEITAAASTSFAEEPSLAQEPSLALEQHQHIKNYGQVPEIHQRENSGFTKQWGISDKRVAKAMLKKRSQMTRLGANGLSMHRRNLRA
ncbi:hypothetical protein ACHAXN_005246, partial [Cyclotella atomus]